MLQPQQVRSSAVAAASRPLPGSKKLLLLMGLFWDGFPFAIVGISTPTIRYLVGAVIVAATLMFIVSNSKRLNALTRWETYPVLLIVYTFICTIISATVFYPQPVDGWLFAYYSLTPLFLIFFVRVSRLSSSDLIDVLVSSSIFIVLMVWLDQVTRVGFMETYTRAATADLDQRRIVIYKTQISVATAICYVRLVYAKQLDDLVRNGAWFLLTFGCLAIVMESRLTLAALLLALAGFTLIMLSGSRRVWATAAGGIFALAGAPYFLDKYLEQASRQTNYIQDDVSIQWRLKTVEYYYDVFERTYGLGFGVMSSGENRDNPLAFAQWSAGSLVGSEGYNFYLADTGLMSSFFQFGFIGFIMTLLMSLTAALTLIRIGVRHRSSNAKELGMVGLVMLFYVVSPWPTNFFTLEWSVYAGAVFWCLAAVGASEYPPQKASRIAQHPPSFNLRASNDLGHTA